MSRIEMLHSCGRRRHAVIHGATLAVAAVVLLAQAAGAVEIVSIAVSGKAGNFFSSGPIANADGNFIAFYSDAFDLVHGDVNQARDVFVRDRGAQTTEIISVNSAGEQANRPSHAQGDTPAINGAGDVVAFYSDATNLVADDTNAQTDVFVRNRGPQTTEIVSLAADGAQGNGPSLNPSIDLSGNLVAYQSLASNLVGGDSNGVSDIFVRDRAAATTERICDNVQGNGSSFAPAISADGFVVAFTSAANNLVAGDSNGKLDVFTCDRRTGAIEMISVSSAGVLGNGDSILPAISFDGRFVAYKSLANNLVPNDHNNTVDVFVRDRTRGTTERVSVNTFGGDANDASYPPSISFDGRFVAFGSAANNLVHSDFNELPSVFVRDITMGFTLLVDVNDAGEQADAATLDVPPAISGDGRQIGYVSLATNLNPNDRNDSADVYLGRNPFFCDDVNPCPPPLICVDGMCVPPSGCDERTGTCTPTSTRTSSPTPTNTAPPSNDCCQCANNTCDQPGPSGCRPDCVLVSNAGCLSSGNCATFTTTPTVTPTATPTNTAKDCCQCGTEACEQPGAAGCRAGCDIVPDAVCLNGVHCATLTPMPITPTPTVTPTLTKTVCALATATPCQLGSIPNCSDPSDPCTCNGCIPCPQPTTCGPGAQCVYHTFNSCVCSCETPPTLTPTPVHTSTLTPVVTPTKKKLDHDGCQLSPQSSAHGSGALLWLASAAALLWRRRRDVK